MAFGDDRVVVDVKDLPDGDIEYTAPDGKKAHYYPGRNMHLVLGGIEERLSAAGKDEAHAQPWVKRYLHGEAQLEQDYDIAILGVPRTVTQRIPVSIRPAPEGQLEPASQAEGEQRSKSFDLSGLGTVGSANLGFLATDWEIGTEDSWWAEVYTSEAVFNAVLQAVRTGGVRQISIGLACTRGLYTDEHPMAPICAKGHLFLRPNRQDNTVEIPEMAQGAVSYLNVALGASRPGPAGTPKALDETELDELPPAAPAEPAAAQVIAGAAERLLEAVGKLRGTVRWLVAGVWALALVALVTSD